GDGRGRQALRPRVRAQKKGRAGSRRTRPSWSVRKTYGSDRFLEILGDAERYLLRRLDLDLLAGRGIATHARRPVPHLQDAEPSDTNLVALLEVPHHKTDELVERARRVLLGHAGLLGQFGRNLGEWNRRSGGLCGSHSGGVPLRFSFRQPVPDGPGAALTHPR